MTEEVLYTGPIDNIATLAAAFNFPLDAYVLVENFPLHVVAPEDRQYLLRFLRLSSIASPDELAGFTSGRIFHEDFELRWELVSGKTRAVYLGVKVGYEETLRAVPGFKQDKETLQNLNVRSREYYLFGQLLAIDNRESMGLPTPENEEYYAEARIPRLLRYPVKPNNPNKEQHVQLIVKEYSDKSTGQIKLFRFSELKTVE